MSRGKGEGDLVRLNKFIAASGICSRREADVLIRTGVISVNGDVNRPKLGADFDSYQKTLTSHQSMREIAKRVHCSSPQLNRRLHSKQTSGV